MKNRSFASLCFGLTPLSLLACAALALWLPVRGAAQDAPDRPEAMQNSSQNKPLPNQDVDARRPPARSDEAASSSTPAPTDTTRPLPKTPRGPANPLVLVGPKNQTGNATVYYDRNGKRRSGEPTLDQDSNGADDQRAGSVFGPAKRTKPLPFFGYDFFQPARDVIIARRAYLKRRYSGIAPGSDIRTRRGSTPEDSSAGQDDTGYGTDASTDASKDEAGSDGRRRLSRRRTKQYSQQYPQYPQQYPQGLAGDVSRDANASPDSTDLNSNAADTRSDVSDDSRPDTSGDTHSQTEMPPTDGVGPDEDVRPYGKRRDRTQRPQDRTRPDDATQPNDATLSDSDTAADGDASLDNTPHTDMSRETSPLPPGTDGNLGANTGAVDAFHEVADPLTQLYRNVSASLPPSYQLAPGDRLAVRYWSPTMAPREVARTVDAQGGILIEGLGRVIVRGLTAAQAENTLRLRLRRLYRNADASITLKELRTISVTISGEAFAPGTYVVPAVSTAFNVLYAAGGPTEDGSLRDIQIRRQGKLVGTLDIYKFLVGGGKTANIALQPGDLIYIPARLSRIALSGEVRLPAIFEITDRETLHDALRYAGGIKPSGVDQRVQIHTLDPGTARVLKDVNLKDSAVVDKLPLYDGDEVTVFSVRSTVANRVTVEGAVDQPGDYGLLPGMRLSDLLARARGPLDEAYMPRADLFRWNADNTLTLVPVNVDKVLAHDPAADLPLVRWDRLKIYTRQEVAWTGRREITVRGAVQRPGVYYRSENMHVRDLLLMAGGPMPDASLNRAVLLHQHSDGSFSYDYIDIASILKSGAAQDVALQDNDVLAVYRIGEAQFTPDHLVAIRGQVVAPGTYPRGEGMRLSDLLQLAGGFRPGAGSRVTVAHAHKTTDISEAQPSLVTVVFNDQRTCAAQDNIPLEDGDVVTIQGVGGFKDHVSVVTINGAVNRPGPVILTDKMRLSDALREAGGLRPEAFPDGVEFTRAPDLMATAGQKNLADLISRLNTLLNQNDYKIQLAKSDLERIKAVGDTGQSDAPLPLPMLGGGGSSPAMPAAAAATLTNQIAQRDLVSPARTLAQSQLQPNGNIAVNLSEALRHPGGSEDIALMDGDTLTVPEKPTTVQVVGAVFNARGVLFRPGASLDYYVAQAGGFAPDAAQDRIEIIHAGGGLIPAGKVRTLQPGDLVLVPTHVLAAKLDHRSSGVDSFFRSLTSSAITLKVLSSVFGL